MEAFTVSLALAIAGVMWFGNPTATSAGGIDLLKIAMISASDTDSEPEALVFQMGFVWLIAPIGATVVAWEIALLLQHIADRHSNEQAISLNLGNFLVVEILAMCLFCGSYFLHVYYVLLPFVLPAAALIAKLFTGHPHCLSLCRLKMLVGIGVGFGISYSYILLAIFTMYPQWTSSSKVEECFMFAAAAVVSLVPSKYLGKAIGESFQSSPVDMGVLAWTLNCCKRDLAGNPGREADPTVFGTALVTCILSIRTFFVYCVVIDVLDEDLTLF